MHARNKKVIYHKPVSFLPEWRSPADALKYDHRLLYSIFRRLSREQNGETMFSKHDIVRALETQDGFLQKRPNLRGFHTRVASMLTEKEVASLELFRVNRIRNRTMSYADAREILEEVCRHRVIAAELPMDEATYKPMWCVKDPKMKLHSPATTYQVVHIYLLIFLLNFKLIVFRRFV